ncbi:hypothetical protein [Arthrobacter tecti]
MPENWSIWGSLKNLIASRWRIIVFLFLCGFGAGVVYGAANPVIYSARAEVVTGNYSLPTEIGTVPAVEKAGPLGLELPAETQARIISSPAISAQAADALGLDAEDAAALAASTKATPTTDNSFAVVAGGASADIAAANANATAEAFLQYRAERGRTELLGLADQARSLAEDNLQAAVALDKPIDEALGTDNTSYASVLLTRRQELERAAGTANAAAAALESAAEGFEGGGGLLRPATAQDASPSLSIIEFALLGTVGGLIAGLAGAALLRQISDKVTDPSDVERTTGISTVFVQKHKSSNAVPMQLMVRSVQRAAIDNDVDSQKLILVALSDGDNYGMVTAQMAEGMRGLNNAVALVSLSPTVSGQLQHAELPGRPSLVPLAQLHGAAVVNIAADIGQKPDLVLAAGSPRENYDALILAPGAVMSKKEPSFSLPPRVSGPVVVVVRKGVDNVHHLSDAVELFRAAGLPVVAVILLQEAGRLHRWLHQRRRNGVLDRKPQRSQRHDAMNGPTSRQSEPETGTSRTTRSLVK